MEIPQLIENHKHIFGAYSAMALSNIRTILNHIATLACIDFDPDDKKDDYWKHPCMEAVNLKNQYKDAKKEEFVMEKLKHHFPFAPVIAEAYRQDQAKRTKDKADKARFEGNYGKLADLNKKLKALQCVSNTDIYYLLKKLFSLLKNYRNHTAHYEINDMCFDNGSDLLIHSEQPLSYMLNSYFTVALRDAAKKYSYSTEALAFIQNHRHKKDKKLDTNFFLSIQHKNGTDKLHLSGVGVVLLICMFLEKKYVNVFLQKLPIYGPYGKQSKEADIIRHTFAIHTAVLPKERIQSEKSDLSVALDMLGELKRCPKELFDTLSYADQNAFRIISSDMSDVLQMRHSDRFAQLSLEYIDRRKLFSSIRFHLNMGKLRYLKTADKHCIDGISRVRVLEKDINAFGRAQEAEQKRKEEGFVAWVERGENIVNTHTNVEIRDFEHVKRDDADPANYPYITDTYTRYLLTDNKIEMCFDDVWPTVVKVNDQKWTIYNEKPKCRMSVFELPAMMFHIMLCGHEATERLIRAKAAQYDKLFKAMTEGTLTKDNIGSFGIALCDMPQKVLDCVSGKDTGKSLAEQIKKEIDEAFADTRLRIERLEADKRSVTSAQNKMGKRGFRSIQPGKLADWLAADIVKHQPTLLKDDKYGTDRITGMNYRVMQSAIATFNCAMPEQSLDALKKMFANAQLISSDKKAHPFLHKALNANPKNTVELYEKYFQAKLEYYKNLDESLKSGEAVKLPYLNAAQNKWMRRGKNFYQTTGAIYSEDMPIELPRQMFDADIRAELAKMPEMSGADLSKGNVTYLIAEYVKRVLHDDFQPFYTWNRNYRFTDMMICEENRKTRGLSTHFIPLKRREEIWEQRAELKEKYKKWAKPRMRKNPDTKRLPDEEKEAMLDKRIAKCRIEFQKSERAIRRYKVQDALMFMMAKKMFKQDDEQDKKQNNFKVNSEQFALKLITPDAERGILSEVIPINFTFAIGGKKYTIHSSGMKIKNYGDFFKLINDKRLKSLLNNISNSTIDKDQLDKEFSTYDDMRPKAVELVFELEKAAYKKHEDLKDKVDTEAHFDFGRLLEELQKHHDLTFDGSYKLSQIRNAFSHNQYPNALRIKSNIPEIAREMVKLFEANDPFKKD